MTDAVTDMQGIGAIGALIGLGIGPAIGAVLAAFALFGLLQALAGWKLTRDACRIDARAGPGMRDGTGIGMGNGTGAPGRPWPRLTVMKPLHGAEPLLEQALESFCAQDYPAWQIVFGLQDPKDPALAVLRRLRARHPALDMAVVVNPDGRQRNRKVANLINMLPFAKHDLLVISDSDIHVAPDYLRRVASALDMPGTGLVTSLYSGRIAKQGVAAQLAAMQIEHAFLPGVLMARRLGRQACLGATMALHRETLARAGGLEALGGHVADDAVLGLLVNRLGLGVRLCGTIPETTVPEASLRELMEHELRWGRTTRSIAPVGFALSALQYPLFWGLLALATAGGAAWGWAVLLACWAGRAAQSAGIDRALRTEPSMPRWRMALLLPLRDLLSVLVLVLSYKGNTVRWRGRSVSVSRAPAPARGLRTARETGSGRI